MANNKYGVVLALHLLIIFIDLCFNTASVLFFQQSTVQLMLFILQDTLIVMAIIVMAIMFSSTFIFQAGLISVLLKRFAATIVVSIAYLFASILLHIFSLLLLKSCKEWHHYHMEYLQQFLERYDQQPKFSLTWLSYVAHDDVNGLFAADNYFYDFFRKNEQKLENAFVFIMGDHGQRVGEIHETPIGVIEDNNPLLFMVLPEYLRDNTHLLKNLRENSRQLISQYDVYATLASIVKNGENMTPESKFDHLKTNEWDMLLHGSSMLYPFEKQQARHCGNLMIPFEVCQCQFQQVNLTNSHSSLATQLANFVVENINLAINSSEISSLCAPLKLDPDTPVQILELEPDKHTNTFHLRF